MKYEYKIVKGVTRDGVLEVLNCWGEEGWEFIDLIECDAFFKRELLDRKEPEKPRQLKKQRD